MFIRFGVLLLVGSYVSVTSALPPCVCTREMQPVCGSDGQTYSNKCLLNCKRIDNRDLKIEKIGPCEYEPPACFCTYEYNPVCGDNGVTYPNECALECENGAVQLAYKGECRTKREDVLITPLIPCMCTREKNPVCGTDGNTYSNPCMLNCAQKGNGDLQVDHAGSCSTEVKVVEEAENVWCSCPKNMDQVCASNGVTFNNLCLMECSGTHLTVAHHGPCESA